MTAAVVEPAGVVEFVGDVFVMTNVAFARVGRDIIARAGTGEGDETFAIGGPLEGRHAIFQVADYLGFAARHCERANLRARTVAFDSRGRRRGIGCGGGGGRGV